MVRWQRWWWGLVALFPLVFLPAVNLQVPVVQTDVQRLSKQALASQGFDWAQVRVTGRDVVLTGQSPTPEGQKAAQVVLEGLRAVRTVDNQSGLLPSKSPYVTTFKREGQQVVLSGFAPDQPARQQLVATAKQLFTGAQIADRLELARGAGARDTWLAGASFALTQLSKMVRGEVVVKDMGLSLTGRSLDMPSLEALRESLLKIPQGLTLASQDVAPSVVSPYVLALAKQDGFVVQGFVPDDAAQSRLVAALQLPATSVAKLNTAGGFPASARFEDLTDFLQATFAFMARGRANLKDDVLIIEGEALDTASYLPLKSLIQKGVTGLTVQDAGVQPPVVSPYRLSVRRDGGRVVVSGFYPDPSFKDQLMETLSRRFQGETFVDQLELAGGAPRQLFAAFSASLSQFSRLDAGSLSVQDTVVLLAGDAYYEAAVPEIVSSMTHGLPPGYSSQVFVQTKKAEPVVSGADCQKLLSDFAAKASIQFVTGRSELSQDGVGVLERLVALTLRCGAAKIEVAGHTDNVGEDEANYMLSQRRAQSVVDYLARAGVDVQRLHPVGYGSTRPVVPNDTDEGRARNRRIDFVVKP